MFKSLPEIGLRRARKRLARNVRRLAEFRMPA
jgi:hypothetical protein